MTLTKQVFERRVNKRFKVPRDAFVAIRPHYIKVGQILDVSMSGLSFRYIAGEEMTNEPLELDIFMAGRAFYLYQVPFKMVSDFETTDDPTRSSVTMKRSGVQFRKLTPHQASQLEYFIQNYTTGAA